MKNIFYILNTLWHYQVKYKKFFRNDDTAHSCLKVIEFTATLPDIGLEF
jgi:hypothetical protein